MTTLPDTGWRGEPLPRGRHKLSADEVQGSQRERLLRAMLEGVGEAGYAATTVPQVTARARVSRTAFYREFADKEDCFLALCDALADELLADVGHPDGDTFAALLADGMVRYLRWWADRPGVARAYLVELPAAGVRAVEQRRRQLARFADLLAGLAAVARTERPGLGDLDPVAPRLLAAGITEVVAAEVRDGRVAALPDLAPSLTRLAAGLLAA